MDAPPLPTSASGSETQTLQRQPQPTPSCRTNRKAICFPPLTETAVSLRGAFKSRFIYEIDQVTTFLLLSENRGWTGAVRRKAAAPWLVSGRFHVPTPPPFHPPDVLVSGRALRVRQQRRPVPECRRCPPDPKEITLKRGSLAIKTAPRRQTRPSGHTSPPATATPFMEPQREGSRGPLLHHSELLEKLTYFYLI